jgi:DeoR family transcriptional regulator, fructose operon transcriptional repressor
VFPAERRRQIEILLNSEGSVSVFELSKMFKVSEMTIHRDLNVLDKMGLIEKTRGGAIASRPYSTPIEYRNRIRSNESLKAAIGKKAVEFIKEGETIFLEPGTTALQVARNLRGFKDLRVYTNGPAVIMELAKIPSIEVHCTGGLLSTTTMAYVGPDTERLISQIRPDKAFIGAQGVNIVNGVMDPFPMMASFKRKIAECSQEVYLLVTPDKIGITCSQVSVPLAAIDVVITNKDAPEYFLKELEGNKIHCVLVSAQE